MQQMEGFLEHLELASGLGPALLHKKSWTRRFFRLNAAFRSLEFFTDATQQEPKGRLQLTGAVVHTAEELGELLSQQKSKMALENSRRFVFRLTEHSGHERERHHYLCAELSDEGDGGVGDSHALVQASREYMDTWVRALQSAALGQQRAHHAMDLRELNEQIATFMNRMHLSAHVCGRTKENGKTSYHVTVKAWILERELVLEDEVEINGRSEPVSGEVDNVGRSWQILEYSCAWKVSKSTTELRAFDSQLRQFFGVELRDVALPTDSLTDKLKHIHVHASASQEEAENQRHVQAFNGYLQSLLCLPAFSSFGSEAATMLDTFLEISTHLATFRKLEKQTGQSMHLRDRQVVSWEEREAFEAVYKLHLDVVAAQQERLHRDALAKAQLESKTDRHHEHHHHHHHHKSNPNVVEDAGEAVAADVVPLPVPAPIDVSTEEARASEAVRARIARIGHQLISEAFTAPSTARTST